MLERFDLRGKTILLTGGAGLYGRGLAKDIASANARLIIASRDLGACQGVAEELGSEGAQVHAESLDQADEASILALRERIWSRFGGLHGLVNNAVARPMRGPDGRTEDWEESLRVNATGLFLMHRHFGESMARDGGGGSIVNIGSIQGMAGPFPPLYEGTGQAPGAPDYFFHKGGMLNLTRYYAARLGQSGVRVNCLSPGGFLSGQPEAFVEAYSRQTYLGRMGNSTDLGGAVVFLLGEASAYITGTNLPVDGGYTAH
jgi:NAD(P)-dependent dehydrogenase (short-subunit alcohol dehydrogenase family)